MRAETNRVSSLTYHHLLALLLVFISFFMSAYFSRTVFERLPHLEDEVAYLFEARMLAHGDLTIETPQPRRAYWQPFVVDFAGKRFGKYPPGWPALLATGVLMGQLWVVNALFAGLTVALTAHFGRKLFDADTGLIAAALVTFSPMALLLNATLMGHTAALFSTTLFLYGYYRIERGRRHALRWGIVAGVGLGMVAFNRPLTAVGVAAPFVVWSGWRLLQALIRARGAFVPRLRALLALSAVALLLSAVIPLHNHVATGDPTKNLYTLVWSYDRVGFGEGFGRTPHTLEKGLRQARYDLSLTAADLFGWQLGRITPKLQDHLRTRSDSWPVLGLSWILLPFGIAVGARKRWTWLLLAVPAALITVHLAYWIGSQRYSTRYYFEALSAAAVVSALPLAWLARRISRPVVYGGLTLLLIYSFFAYSAPRVEALYRFNFIGQDRIDVVQQRRVDDRPALVIITGRDALWRALGSLMAVTSPYLDSEIVVAWDDERAGVREAILARFPDRQVIEMVASGNDVRLAE